MQRGTACALQSVPSASSAGAVAAFSSFFFLHHGFKPFQLSPELALQGWRFNFVLIPRKQPKRRVPVKTFDGLRCLGCVIKVAMLLERMRPVSSVGMADPSVEPSKDRIEYEVVGTFVRRTAALQPD